MLSTAFSLCNVLLEIYTYQFNKLKHDTNEENKDEDEERKAANIPPMATIEGDEKEVKKGTRIKVLTSNKVFTRIPVLLAQL